MKNLANILLLIPEKADMERGSVAEAWQQMGGMVMRLDRFWEKPTIPNGTQVSIYGNDTFALVVAQVLNLTLVSPDDALLSRLAFDWTKRKLSSHALSDLEEESFPTFIKPLIPKQFSARIYANSQELLAETAGLPLHTQVLVSEVIPIEAEARGFVLQNQLQDLALYEGSAPLTEAHAFANRFLANHSELPVTFVIDLAYNASRGWFVLEFNSSWGAGLNNCHPQKVLNCIRAATHPLPTTEY